jgi:hypothetical protein
MARRLLELEGGAAGAVYDELHAQLSPVIGATGVELLFVRSAKLAGGDFTGIAGVSLLEGSAKLRECLAARDPLVSPESAAELFATFIALLATFIGERLTTQLLHRAWPAIVETGRTKRKP